MPSPPLLPDLRENTGGSCDGDGWGSVRKALVQAMQEQFHVFHEACSARDREQLRRFERLRVDLRGHIDASLLSAAGAAAGAPAPNTLNKFKLGAGRAAELSEKTSATTLIEGEQLRNRRSVLQNKSLASTLQDTLQASGITELPISREVSPADGEMQQDEEENLRAAAEGKSGSMITEVTHGNRSEGSIATEMQIKQVAYNPTKRSNRKGLVKKSEEKGRLHEFAQTRFFTGLCAFLILANSLFIGYEVDTSMYSALQRPPVANPEWFKMVNRFFCVAFSLELMTRVAAFQHEFFCSLDWKWNVFDVMMVISSLVEEGMEGMEGANMSSIRILRVFRLIRTFRIIRVVNIFRSLRLMVCCIFNSLMSLMWALLLLLLTMYLFSIVCVQGASSHLADLGLGPVVLDAGALDVTYGPTVGDSSAALTADLVVGAGDDLTDEQVWSQLDLQYRSVIRALLTLLMAIAGGVDWYEAVRPLMTINPLYAFLFSAYVVFVLFGVLNVLSAVFVEHALQIRDRDLVVQAEMERTREFMKDMSELFKEADADGSGLLSRAEMELYLQNERVSMYMATHQLDVSDVELMFRLLDVDGTDTVELNEFALGCFRLKGNARCLDVIRMFEVMDTLQSEITLTRSAVNAIVGSITSGVEDSAGDVAHGDAAAGEARPGPPMVS